MADPVAAVATARPLVLPESRKDRYKAEFQNWRKKRTEPWADYAEDLRILVDRAYPQLEAAA